MSEREVRRAVAYLTKSRFGNAIYVTPVHWDANLKRDDGTVGGLVFENDVKLYGKMSDLKLMLADMSKSVALFHSEPLAEKAVEVAPKTRSR